MIENQLQFENFDNPFFSQRKKQIVLKIERYCAIMTLYIEKIKIKLIVVDSEYDKLIPIYCDRIRSGDLYG